MIDRTKISSIVESQLPDFVREDHASFVAFLEAYYEFLETRVENPKTLRDVSTTLEEFIYLFKKELAQNIPFTVVNERFLLTHIKDLYLAKGSEASFKLLFRLLFNKEVTIEYPSKQILRASDGKWNQDVSIFARLNAGNPDDIVGKLVDVVTPNRIIRVMIDRRQDVEIEVDRVVKISDEIFEFYIDRRFFGSISINDRLRYGGIFDATILPTTSKVTIQQGGKGFRIGQLYEIKSGKGAGSVLKISRVDENGGIKAAEFIKYGTGYETNFIATFLAQSGQTTAGAGQAALNIGDGNIGIFETTNGFSEEGYINNANYVAEANPLTPIAWEGGYAGEVLREFSDDGRSAVINSSDPAIISIELGAIAKYPGYFKNNDGFLDDAIYIQDSRYYQAYSYVIKIDERLANYQSAVKTLLHPAGMALFGEYDIRNEFDLSLQIESMIKILSVNRQDEFSVEDGTAILDFSKVLSDEFGTDEILVYAMHKPLSDEQAVEDLFTIRDFGKSITDDQIVEDSIAILDFSKLLIDTATISETNILDFSKTLSDETGTDDSAFYHIEKPLSDEQVVEDIAPIFDFGKVLSDEQEITDAANFYLDKPLEDSVVLTEAAILDFYKTLSDSTDGFSETTEILFAKYIEESILPSDEGHLYLNPYIDFPDLYWGESYSEGRTSF